MKKGIIFAVFAGVGFLFAGLCGAYWYGNQPVKEYYQNGKIKSITERRMYQPSGKYQLFAQDGTLIEEYNQVKGVKNGKGTIYFKDGSADFNFVDNKLNGAFVFNEPSLSEFFADGTSLSAENSELKLKNGDFFEANGKISCEENDFLLKFQAFLNEQNYENFKNFFGCVDIEKANFEVEGVDCGYSGAYRFPKFLSDSKISCAVTNAEFLQGYAQGFDLANNISFNVDEQDNEKKFSAGEIGNIESLNFKTDFNMENKKLSFLIATDSDKVKLEQNGSFGGFEEVVENGVEFAYSPKEDADVKKLVLNILTNLYWSDWSAKINDKKRFTVSGDFNVINGFSDGYVMSYYSNDEVTTQWKFNDKGSQLTSKYPNSNTPMFSFGINVNDGFNKAYKVLVKEGLNLAMSDSAGFNPNSFERIQNAGIALLKNFKSFSGVLFDANGQKTISGVAALQNKFSIEQFLIDPQQFVNAKIIIYKNNEPAKVYEGNLAQGFYLNGKKLSDEQTQEEMQYVFEALKESFEGIVNELEKSYGNLSEDEATWIDSDIDPFLYGIYKGYTAAESQFNVEENSADEEFDEDEISVVGDIERVVDNIHDIYGQNFDGYGELDDDEIIYSGLAPSDENGRFTNSFGGKVVIKSSPKSPENLNGAFIIALSAIPDDECERFLAEDVNMLPQEGIIGLSIGNMDVAPQGFAELNKLTANSAENAGLVEPENGIAVIKINAVEDEEIQDNIKAFCSGKEKRNFIAVKYY